MPVLPFLCMTAAWLIVRVVGVAVGTSRPVIRTWATAITALAIVAPSARNVVLLDRLFERFDSRLIVARALPSLIPAGSLVYHSGESYGHVPYDLPGEQLSFRECEYNAATGRFSPDGRLPDSIILQRSPLVLYSNVPDGVERIVRDRYALVSSFRSATDDATRVYDQQDALFLPLAGLEGVERMGPSFEIYRLREAR
jgi:hypothetical protein